MQAVRKLRSNDLTIQPHLREQSLLCTLTEQHIYSSRPDSAIIPNTLDIVARKPLSSVGHLTKTATGSTKTCSTVVLEIRTQTICQKVKIILDTARQITATYLQCTGSRRCFPFIMVKTQQDKTVMIEESPSIDVVFFSIYRSGCTWYWILLSFHGIVTGR